MENESRDFIKTATGKVIGVDLVATISSPNMLYIRVVGMSIPQTAAIFGNPEELTVLEYAGIKLYGYTELTAMVNEDDAVRVNLRRA